MGANIRMAASLYINYTLLGMVNLIIALRMGFLTVQFDTDAAAISMLIPAVEICGLFRLSFACKLLGSPEGKARALLLLPCPPTLDLSNSINTGLFNRQYPLFP